MVVTKVKISNFRRNLKYFHQIKVRIFAKIKQGFVSRKAASSVFTLKKKLQGQYVFFIDIHKKELVSKTHVI